ncbi:MAG TPA: hypothetical protein VMP01_03805 [Pirellulaceae bacterium]|nr:hypothetical protein [Pirellulaceae bacterium]
MSRRERPQSRTLLPGWRKILPPGWGSVLRAGLLIWVVALGHLPSVAPVWSSLARPLGHETNRPLESESPTESPESASAGVYLYHGQRSDRSLAGERAGCKLPPNHLTSHFSRGRGFLMAESCFDSEHDLRNGTGAHLRC